MLTLPAANIISESKKLQAIYDKAKSNVRSLKNIGIAPDTYGSFFAPVIMAKIPEELRIAITRELPAINSEIIPGKSMQQSTIQSEDQSISNSQFQPSTSLQICLRFSAYPVTIKTTNLFSRLKA